MKHILETFTTAVSRYFSLATVHCEYKFKISGFQDLYTRPWNQHAILHEDPGFTVPSVRNDSSFSFCEELSEIAACFSFLLSFLRLWRFTFDRDFCGRC